MPPKKILCYGDSNTYGYDPGWPFGGRYGAEDRWCDLLCQALGCTVVNDGENGRTIPADKWSCQLLIRRIRRESPDLLLILLGTNDILSGIRTPEEIASAAEALIRELRRDFPELKILLLSPPKIAIPEFSDSARELSGQYRQLAIRENIGFLDSFRWKVPIASGGVHFTEAGHHVFARNLIAALRNSL